MKVPSPLEARILSTLWKERTGVRVELAYHAICGQKIPRGSLYTTLRRMRSRGWVKVLEIKGDLRERRFLISGHGRKAFSDGLSFYWDLAHLKCSNPDNPDPGI